ncbi:hypothetical protein CRV00_02435 [Malaciobacter molluscorum]|uniref:DUF3010 family protein n=1 Tax=Malaciobacter molluscorum TaxID=1032072 RepID=UPI00100AD079|nr:DUF3010 family protein [Malaciobacter molluscorum]RXJ96492.1 hypothetical protein CRV00_02435 [Malaciobacter molluscorum]
MIICGIELKSNYAILSVLKNSLIDDIIDYVDLKIKKITLEDDENKENIELFFKQINEFFEVNNIDKVVIKKRAKKGNFAGGAVTFKIEGLIQLSSLCKVELVSSQTLSSFEKRNNINFPSNLKKYQEQSYICALSSFCK